MFNFHHAESTGSTGRHPRWRRPRRLGVAAAGAATLAVIASGCTGVADTPPSSTAGVGPTAANTLVLYTGTATDFTENFNPWSMGHVGGIGSIYEPLFYFNVTSSKPPVPRLGTKYSWNADGTQLSVETRSGVKWSDGKPFSANDVVYTLDLLKSTPALNTIGYDGTATATDDTHVEITFDHTAFVDAPETFGLVNIVPEHLWKSIADPTTDLITHPVGTGPFTLSDFKPQAFTLAANPEYWGGEPAVKAVRYVALSGNQAGQAALQAGTIDWQTGPIPDPKNVEQNYPGYKQITTYQNQVTLDACSNEALGCKGPQTDPAVRKAIYYAIDRTQLNALAYDGIADLNISPGFALAPRDKALITSADLAEPYAPEHSKVSEATALLEGDGYTKGSDGYFEKDGKRLSMTVAVVSGYTDYITALSTMSEQLKKVGIELVVQQSAYNEWSSTRSQGRFQLLMDSVNQGSAPDPYYPYTYFFSTSARLPSGRWRTRTTPGSPTRSSMRR